jgi:large subunit ribosomal protein L20
VRVKKAVASRKRRKRVLAKAKGFVGDRKNHIRLTKDAVMKAMAFHTIHRKHRKRQFRSLWIMRISVAAKIYGISYNKLIHGLQKAGCSVNRKILADIACTDMKAFSEFADVAKAALIVS